MSNVKALRPEDMTPPDQAVPETVRLLENFLEMAKTGEIRSIGLVGVKANNHLSTAWHSEGQYYTLVGGMGWFQHRMHQGE